MVCNLLPRERAERRFSTAARFKENISQLLPLQSGLGTRAFFLMQSQLSLM